MLCQYDAYPIWPAIICKDDDGSLKGKFRAVVSTSDGSSTTAYHCFFFDDDSSAWIRADLIVKFHPSLLPFVRVASTEVAYHTSQNLALSEAQQRYASNAMNEARSAHSDPLSTDNDQDRIALVTMLGQWFLQGNLLATKPRLELVDFVYDAALADGRKLPHCLRTKLAPARMWPRIVLPAVRIAGQVEASPVADVRRTGATGLSDKTAWRGSEAPRVARGRKTLPVFECGAPGRATIPETAMATGVTMNGTVATGGGVGKRKGSGTAPRCKKRPRMQEHSANSTRLHQTSAPHLPGTSAAGEHSVCTEISENGSPGSARQMDGGSSRVDGARELQSGTENLSDGVSETMEFDGGDNGQQGRVGWAAMSTVETCQFHPAGQAATSVVDLT